MTFIRNIINSFYSYLVKCLKEEQLLAFYVDILYGVPNNIFFDRLKLNFSNYNKETNLYAYSIKAFINKINKKCENKQIKHLCFDCPVPIKNCPKIMDVCKKNIADYDFIIDGYQKYNNYERRLDSPIVTRCRKLNDYNK